MKSPPQLNSWIGRSVGDHQRYRLDKPLAVGGMGEVFVAMDTLLGKQVALKLIKDTLVASAELRKRFEREVALCAALKSDHIVEVSDYGVTTEGYPFFVMEYLRGQSLGQLLRQKQRLPLERTVNLMAQVCDGLHLAHEGVALWRENATVSEQIKVVHSDLKPDNIFLVPTALGELVKILDFGIAKISKTQAENTKLTDMFLGTFHYAAPEQLEVEKDLDRRADIYSLGIIVYEMLSGTDPFDLGFNIINDVPINNMSWALAHTSKPPIPLRSQPGLSQISPELEAVVMRCLRKVPDERFASVNELKRALQAAIFNPSQSQENLEQTNKIIDSTELQVSEQHNLNPTLMIRETRVGENKKQTWQLLLKITAVAAAIVGLGYYYYYPKEQVDQPEKAVLQAIQLLKEGKNYEECLNKAKAVLPISPFYTKAQYLINECQRLAQDDSLLTRAKELAKKNNFKDAISEASKIQLDSSYRPVAQQMIDEWYLKFVKQVEERYKQSYNLRDIENVIDITKAMPKTSVAKSAEEMSKKWQTEWNSNENYLKAAHNALEQGKWQEAIDETNKVRLFEQEVKQNTTYWQNKMKPIIETAQKRIAASVISGSRTNNAIQPEVPPSQPISSPVPYLSRRPLQTKPSQSPRSKLLPLQRKLKLPPPQPISSPVPYVSRRPVQTKPKPQSSTPIQLSPEAQRILCQQFPLNSRCGSKH